MRLPVLDNQASHIDESLVRKMLEFAIEHGVHYVDTAYTYHGGQSEPFVGRTLKDGGNRNRVKLATKCPVWPVQSHGDFDHFLNEQLLRLQTEQNRLLSPARPESDLLAAGQGPGCYQMGRGGHGRRPHPSSRFLLS